MVWGAATQVTEGRLRELAASGGVVVRIGHGMQYPMTNSLSSGAVVVTYHINNDHEVGECSAKNLTDCPFYNPVLGDANHYTTEEQANEAAELLRAGKYPMFSIQSTRSIKNRDKILNTLNTLNIVLKDGKMSLVASETDIITKWFNGSSENYRRFLNMSNNSDLKPIAQRDIVKMLTSGLNVRIVDSLDEAEDTKDGESDVVLLSEKTAGMSIT